MRPINLIPEEERRKQQRTVSDGAFGWSVIAVLVFALIGAFMLATTSSAVSERKTEVAHLEQQVADTEQRAEELAPYVAFNQTAEARRMTVASLAASRFDWERVMRELSLVIPDDIVIETLTASISPEVSVPGGTSISLRAESEGPALELTGCGTGARGESQEAVARFISALYGIDGVTRVGVPESAVEEGSETVDASARCHGAEVATFQAVAVFDYAPIAGEPVEPPPVIDPDRGSTDVPTTADAGAGQSQGLDASSQAATDASRDPARSGG